VPGLEDLYREIILDHHRNPRNRGELAPPAPHATGHNPLCGDEIDVYLEVEGGVVSDVKIGGPVAAGIRKEDQDLKAMLNKAIAALPLKLRTVFLLRDVQGLSIRETAETLSIGEPAVKTRLMRARIQLRATIALFCGTRALQGGALI